MAWPIRKIIPNSNHEYVMTCFGVEPDLVLKAANGPGRNITVDPETDFCQVDALYCDGCRVYLQGFLRDEVLALLWIEVFKNATRFDDNRDSLD